MFKGTFTALSFLGGAAATYSLAKALESKGVSPTKRILLSELPSVIGGALLMFRGELAIGTGLVLGGAVGQVGARMSAPTSDLQGAFTEGPALSSMVQRQVKLPEQVKVVVQRDIKRDALV